MAQAFVYILEWPGTRARFIGVASDLGRRVRQHRAELCAERAPRLVYVEAMASLIAALAREQQLRQWRREWVERLIAARNPGRRDLLEPACPGVGRRPEGP